MRVKGLLVLSFRIVRWILSGTFCEGAALYVFLLAGMGLENTAHYHFMWELLVPLGLLIGIVGYFVAGSIWPPIVGGAVGGLAAFPVGFGAWLGQHLQSRRRERKTGGGQRIVMPAPEPR